MSTDNEWVPIQYGVHNMALKFHECISLCWRLEGQRVINLLTAVRQSTRPQL